MLRVAGCAAPGSAHGRLQQQQIVVSACRCILIDPSEAVRIPDHKGVLKMFQFDDDPRCPVSTPKPGHPSGTPKGLRVDQETLWQISRPHISNALQINWCVHKVLLSKTTSWTRTYRQQSRNNRTTYDGGTCTHGVHPSQEKRFLQI